MNDLGYLSEEWFGIKHTTTQFAVFTRANHGEQKLIFCTDPGSAVKKYDLLLPITEPTIAAHRLPEWQPAENRL